MGRLDWLKLTIRHGRRGTRARQIIAFIAFEVYYQLCRLGGRRARHVFLEPKPVGINDIKVGERILLTWTDLPPLIRLLGRVFPFGRAAHAEFAPYTPSAAEAARASGRFFAVVDVAPGEFKATDRL